MPFGELHIPMGVGPDEYTDGIAGPNERPQSVINGRYDKNGRIVKRYGTAALTASTTSGGTLSSCSALFAPGDELCMVDGHAIYSYSSELAKWQARDRVPEPLMSLTPLVRADTSAIDADSAYANGIAVYAWVQTAAGTSAGTVAVTIQDYARGTLIKSQYVIDGNTTNRGVRCLVAGNYVFVFYWRAGSILFQKINTTDPANFSALPNTLTANASPTLAYFDAAAITGSSNWVIAYNKLDASFQVETYDSNAAMLHSYNTAIVPQAIGVGSYTGENVFVAYATSAPDIRLLVLSSTLTLVAGVGPAIVIDATATNSPTHIGVGRIDSSSWVVAWDTNLGGEYFARKVITTTGGFTGSTHKVYDCALRSRPFVQGGRVYAFAVLKPSVKDQTNVLVDLATDATSYSAGSFRIVANGTFGDGGILDNISTIRNVWSPATGVYVCASQAVLTGDAFSGKKGVDRLTFDFATEPLFLSTPANATHLICGGTPLLYDGSRATECGFFNRPNITATVQGAGGSMADGSYSYVAVYEWYDAKGQRYQSAPSDASAVTVSAGGGTAKVALTLECLQFTAKMDNEQGLTPPVSIVVYRTAAGPGSVYYRVTPAEVPTTAENVIGTATISFDDTYADASITSNENLYTTSGAADNIVPPSSRYCLAFKNRIWLAGCDDPKVIWYSKQLVFGDAPAFSDSFTIRVDDGGDITGLANLDGTLVVFKRDRIFRVAGDPPDDAGNNSTLTDPEPVATSVGCIDARSIIMSAEGVWFLSLRGLQLLDRSFAVQDVGGPMVDTLGTQKMTGGVLLTTDRQIRWPLENAGQIVWDQVSQGWSLDKYTASDGTSNIAIQSACLHGDVYYFARSNGEVYYEDSTTYLDAGSKWVTLAWQSAWIKTGGIQGFYRARDFYLLVEGTDPFEVDVFLNRDYSGSTAQTSTFAWSKLSALSPKQIRVHVADQKGEAFQVEIVDVADASSVTGKGPTLHSLALRYMLKPTPYHRLPAGAKA